MPNQRNGRTILVAEDELEVRGYLEMALRCLGYSAELAQDGDEVLACLQSSQTEYAAILLDLMMPNRDGIETLRELRHMNPEIPVIVVSGASSPLNIVTAMKNGATDFLCKPVAHEDLRVAITRALATQGTEFVPPARNPVPSGKVFVGRNPQMKEIQALIGTIGWFEPPVLIQGETGSGKEVIARELHAQSPRAHKSFLKLNCAALPSELVESELFGYERGSFTGAFQKKAGMFEMADGGTILLDEIGDMDVRLQAKLLQVLQDHEFQRIGGKETIKVDVRVIAATHRDLEKAITERTFREDLYYRLNVINLALPPLRDRKEDIPALVEHFFNKYCRENEKFLDEHNSSSLFFEPDAMQILMDHAWPGNVRELENVVERAVVLAAQPNVPADVLPEHLLEARGLRIRRDESGSLPADASLFEIVADFERRKIMEQLETSDWSQTSAAEALRIPLSTLNQKIKRLNIEIRKRTAG